MKYYLIVGEASGDLHASHLMKELKARDAEADFRFLGGDLMKAQGGTLVRHYKAPSRGFPRAGAHRGILRRRSSAMPPKISSPTGSRMAVSGEGK